jgi:hypothetical protein
MSPNIKILSSDEADKSARDFAPSIASAYRISTRKTTILDRKYEIPGLDRLLKHKRVQKFIARNERSSMQNGRELDHSKYQENGPENST